MASFFQPASFVPSVRTGASPRFEIFANSALQGDDLLRYWYQYLFLVLGVVTLAVLPSRWTVRRFQLWMKRRKLGISDRPRKKPPSPAQDEQDLSEKATPVARGAIKSFGFHNGNQRDFFLQQDYDLHILGLRRPKVERFEESLPEVGQPVDASARTTFGFLDAWDWGNRTSEYNLIEATRQMDEMRRAQGCAGLVLLANVVPFPKDFNPLLQALRRQSVNVIIMAQPDDPFVDYINFNLVAGIIFMNACVLPNGMRRDFFQASQLREGIGRCARQRKTRPDFFLGFLDLWDVRPTAATVRRAGKFADFHSAIVHVRPRTSATRVEPYQRGKEAWLSGFDWLKKPEVIEVGGSRLQCQSGRALTCVYTVAKSLDQ